MAFFFFFFFPWQMPILCIFGYHKIKIVIYLCFFSFLQCQKKIQGWRWSKCFFCKKNKQIFLFVGLNFGLRTAQIKMIKMLSVHLVCIYRLFSFITKKYDCFFFFFFSQFYTSIHNLNQTYYHDTLFFFFFLNIKATRVPQ